MAWRAAFSRAYLAPRDGALEHLQALLLQLRDFVLPLGPLSLLPLLHELLPQLDARQVRQRRQAGLKPGAYTRPLFSST